MRTTSIPIAAAISLVAGLGSASAAEQFSTLNGVTAIPMSSSDLDAVVGGQQHVLINGTVRLVSFVAAGFSDTTDQVHPAATAAGQGFDGGVSFDGGHMQIAENASGGIIDVCNFAGAGVCD